MKKSKDAWKKVLNDAWKKRSMAFRKKWVPFLLNFAQTDFSKEERLIPYWKAIGFLSSNPEQEFHLFDEDSFDLVWKSTGSHYAAIDLTVVQAEIRKVLKYMGRKKSPPLSDGSPGPSHPIILYGVKTHSGLYVDHGRFVIEQIPIHPPDASENQRVGRSIAWLLSKMINGLPLDSIRNCKGCHHYFLHTSKRERVFCTPSCAGRSIQKEKREELRVNHPRKYKAFLKQQKEIMRRRRSG